jgi:hypothetical protein
MNCKIKGLALGFIIFTAAMLVTMIWYNGEGSVIFLFLDILCVIGMIDWNTQKRHKDNRGLFSDPTDDCKLD